MNTRWLLILLLCWPALLSAEEGLTLTKLWHRLRTHNLRIQQSEQLIVAEEAKLAARWSELTPNIRLQSNWQNTRIRQTPDQTRGTAAASLILMQPLIDKGLWNQVEQAQNLKERQALDHQRLIERLMLELSLTYFDLQEAQLKAEVLNHSLTRTLDRLEQQAYQVLDAGVRSPRDMSLFLLQISQLRLKYRQIIALQKEHQQTLNILVDSPAQTLKLNASHLAPTLYQLNSADSLIEEKIELLEQKGYELLVSAAESRFWPKLSLFGEWSQTRPTNSSEALLERTSTSVGVSLDIPLWSGLTDLHQRHAAIASQQAYSHRLAAQTRERQMRLAEAQNRLSDEYGRFQEAQRVLSLAARLRDAAQKRREADLASFDELIGPEIQWVELSLTSIEAAFSYLRAEAQELQRRGRLSAQELERWDNDLYKARE